MMREIIFRGKRTYSGEWVEGFFVKRIEPLTLIPKCYILVQEEDTRGDTREPTGHLNTEFFCYEVIPKTISQYTGLKDKNGKRIFEGDIVQYYSNYKRSFIGEPGVVEYGEFNCTCCNGVYGWTFDMGDIRENESYVVIGNIHDNPELMEIK